MDTLVWFTENIFVLTRHLFIQGIKKNKLGRINSGMSDSKSENVKVVLRFRPLNKKEEGKDSKDFKLKVNKKQGVIDIGQASSNHQFIFDYVFDGQSSQTDIFATVAHKAVEWVCQGYNATIFVYGATSSGKTHTLFGNVDNKDQKGIIPRCCDLVFETINKSENVVEADMKCSFLEIYREHIRDLLSDNNDFNPDLRIRQSPQGIYVQGLLSEFVYTPADIMQKIKKGTKQRVTASTSLNDQSSRSHAVLTLSLKQTLSDKTILQSKLNLIDLAGSENVGRSEVQGINLAEAQTINKSLSCLGNVIYALTEKGRDHIPYRDSKLTYILQDSLGGNSRTILIATASPSSLCYSETLSTLRFAKRSKDIKNLPKVNKDQSSAELLRIIDELQKRIAELESKCEDSQVIIQAVEQAHSDNKEVTLLRTRCQRLEKRIEFLQEEQKNFNQRLDQWKEFFNKQRELARNTAKELYKERIKNFMLLAELDQFRFHFDAFKQAMNDVTVLRMLVQRAKINPVKTEDNLDLLDENEIPTP